VVHRARSELIGIRDALADEEEDSIDDRRPEGLVVWLIKADLSDPWPNVAKDAFDQLKATLVEMTSEIS
jgi:hypothetical protein